MMALGAMSVVRENGLRVPDDVALVGFDNVPMTELTTPGLTTMAMPMSELGDAAARLARDEHPPRRRSRRSARGVLRRARHPRLDRGLRRGDHMMVPAPLYVADPR